MWAGWESNLPIEHRAQRGSNEGGSETEQIKRPNEHPGRPKRNYPRRSVSENAGRSSGVKIDRYEATKLLEPHLEAIRADVDGRMATSGDDDRVQHTADALSEILGHGHEVEIEIVDKFWSAVDWRLLADMYLGVEGERSI